MNKPFKHGKHAYVQRAERDGCGKCGVGSGADVHNLSEFHAVTHEFKASSVSIHPEDTCEFCQTDPRNFLHKPPFGRRLGSKPEEAVDHPVHYGGADNPYETIKVLEAWLTPEEMRGFCKGNAIKYLSRAGKKSAATRLEDQKKAQWYLDRLNAEAK